MPTRKRLAKRNAQTDDKPGGAQQLVIDFEAERKRRMRYGALPKPPEEVAFAYAKAKDRTTNEGEVIAWLMTRPEWLETVGAACDAIEAARPARGPAPSYSTMELEGAAFFQFMFGLRTYRAARNYLDGCRGRRARVALNFDHPRKTRCPQPLELLNGVPSEATMSRHQQRFPVELRVQLYRLYFARLGQLNATDPELREGLRILNIDGSAQLTSFTCPVRDDEGNIRNAKRVTCPEGSYIGHDAPPEKQGMGFGVVPLICGNGLPWAYEHGPITINEGAAAISAVKTFGENILPLIPGSELTVFCADSGFQNRALRALVRSYGMVENIHECSHTKGRASTDREVTSTSRRELEIEGYPKWYANGHRELKCRCGDAHIFRRTELDKNGEAVIRVEGRCAKCGSLTITSGLWKTVVDTRRPTGDPRGMRRLVRVQNGDPASVIDWQFGNPLTFNDPLAEAYGNMRFGHGEGFNGACVTRFKLLKTKGHYRTQAKAELHALSVFCAMHGITAYRRDAPAARGETEAPEAPLQLAAAA